MARLTERIGYGFGDMASSMFWKMFSFYLPFFYSNVYKLELTDAAMLVLITRIWDAVSDPMMGIVADRTRTRWGKYRPYLLFVAPVFSVCGILLFTTPEWEYGAKLVWAYITYILMMTVYTAINVPYGAMLGVMTDDSREKTVFSSYRMFFAYGGSFIALAVWEPMVNGFKNSGLQLTDAWQYGMAVMAALCLGIFLLCFFMTKEHVRTVSNVSVASDFKSLMRNKPWWIIIGAALSFNLFSTIRGATAAFYFADIIGFDAMLSFGAFSVLFYAGLFLSVGEVANMVGVATTVWFTKAFGKKSTFIGVNACLAALSILFFFIPVSPLGFWLMLVMQVFISLLTGVMSPLVWSMYADVSDYAELKNRTASTGLIFSSSSMAQKFGGAIGGAAVLWLLGACGYITRTGEQMEVQMQITQPESALMCLQCLMSFIPAAVAVLAMAVCHFYPLTTERMTSINSELKKIRSEINY